MRASPGHQKAQFLEFAIHELRDRQIPFRLRNSSYHSPSGHVFVVAGVVVGVVVTVDTVLLLMFPLLLLLFSLDVKKTPFVLEIFKSFLSKING